MNKRILLILVCVLLAAVLPQFALAATQTIAGVTAVTPDTYASCSTVEFGDTVSFTGVGDRQLVGQIIVDYVLDNGGRQLVKQYSINQTGDLVLFVEYPPVSEWPVLSNGTAELHVDIQLELYQNGYFIATIGPGLDWDVFCNNPPPPPPPPPPTGTQGCTPGYWKQPQHFDSWPMALTPNTSFFSVFGRSVPGAPTLLAGVSLNGGGLNALTRHSVAALLNATTGGVDYPYTADQVIAAFQAAYDSGNYEPTKDAFDRANNLGCPLN